MVDVAILEDTDVFLRMVHHLLAYHVYMVGPCHENDQWFRSVGIIPVSDEGTVREQFVNADIGSGS